MACFSRKCLLQAGVYLRSRSYSTSGSIGRLEPLASSISLSTVKDTYLNFNYPGVEKMESDEDMCVYFKMPGVKENDVKVGLKNNTTLLCIQGEIYDKSYSRLEPTEIHRAFIKLPGNIVRSTHMFKTEMQDGGMLKLTLPKLKGSKIELNDDDTNLMFNKYSGCLYNAISSLILVFARPLLTEFFCLQPYESVTMYKKKTAQSLHLSITPGLHGKMDPVMEGRGLCVSVNMPELNIQDVKSYSKYDAFFIQGKTQIKADKVEYITGIHLPYYYDTRRRMIKEEMHDGIYMATIPIAY